MQKKAILNKIQSTALFACLVLMVSVFSVAKAEYRIVYSTPPASSNKYGRAASNSEDIWKVFQQEFTLNHQADRPEVKEQIAWFMSHRKYLRAAAANARPYMYYIVSQIRKRHLPLEFALLPIIESSYDPFAYSTSGASGLWQMMPATATDFGLKQNWWYDGRRDVVASTNAALDYLVYLQNFFGGNWMFTVAAYNTGQGAVLNAVKKNAAHGNATDFWSLPLAKQTQTYIPKLLALAEMISHPEKYPLDMPPIPNQPYLTQVDVGSQIDLAKAAKLSGLSLSQLKNLNPGFNRWATSPEGPYLLVVPIQNEAELREGLSLIPKGNRVTWERYDVKTGDTLNKIALQYHTSTSVLQQVNKMDTTLIRVGDVIFIPNLASQATGKIPETVSVPAAVYIVQKGDTLMSVAHTLNIPWKTLSAYNHLTSDTLKMGQRLNVPPLAVKNVTPVTKATKKLSYLIQKDDNLGKIAQRFGVSISDIKSWNPSLTSDPILHIGQKLVIFQSVAG